jgi:predicted amino acid dehydrogenase
VKQIINISLGPGSDDYELKVKFKNQNFSIKRVGTDGDVEKASDLLLTWNKNADAIGLGGIQFPYTIGPRSIPDKKTGRLLKVAKKLSTPVTVGGTLRDVSHEWSLRHTHFIFGNNYFTNARVLFFSGMVNSKIARVMQEYTDNLQFADPVLEDGIPRLMGSIKELELYAGKIKGALKWIPGKRMLTATGPVRKTNEYVLRRAVQKAQVLVVPYYNFYRYLDGFTADDLKDKVVITTTAYDDRVAFLKKKEVAVIIDTTPKLFEKVIGVSALEALLLAALQLPREEESSDELLEVISELEMEPRILYPSGKPRRINRFAYIVYPINQEFLKKIKPIEVVSEIAPGAMDTVEKVMAYAPPFLYSKVTGIKSNTGVEAEGWLIGLGETPAQMQAHDPDFTTKRLLMAAKMAKRMGAQIMGIGMFPKAMKSASLEVAKHAALPITTGNSYLASATLWAAAEAVRRMGLTQLKNGKILKARTMVIGATGAIGAICSRLLATAFEEVHMVSRNMAKLLALQESMQAETEDVKLHVSTRADTRLGDMDVVIAASGGAGKVLDIMRLKPGCVVTDTTLPSVFSSDEVARRPDVLVIRSGEILLPGNNIEMKDIGLPPEVAYAGLAETIILALEGRFETYTVGSDPQWEKVKEIYRLGLKHGMQLASISGVNGVLSDEDIARVRACAVKELKRR